MYKVEVFYQFWNTTANAEKQLLQWLGDVGIEEKQGYVTGVMNSVNIYIYLFIYSFIHLFYLIS